MGVLEGRHAIVSGGGTGVGAAVALALGQAGAAVTICGRRLEPLEETAAACGRIRSIQADVTDEASVARLFGAARDACGTVDIVVANAGAAESEPFERTELALFERMIAVNLTGTFLLLRAGLRGMREHGKDQKRYGRLVAIASTAGLKGYAYVSAYCAAKHGAVGLVRALAVETAGTGITANAVCPGYTQTPMLDATISNIAAKTGMSAEAARDRLAAGSPLGRFIEPGEVAAAVAWLCGPGSDAVTGQSISVSGGETW